MTWLAPTWRWCALLAFLVVTLKFMCGTKCHRNILCTRCVSQAQSAPKLVCGQGSAPYHSEVAHWNFFVGYRGIPIPLFPPLQFLCCLDLGTSSDNTVTFFSSNEALPHMECEHLSLHSLCHYAHMWLRCDVSSFLCFHHYSLSEVLCFLVVDRCVCLWCCIRGTLYGTLCFNILSLMHLFASRYFV